MSNTNGVVTEDIDFDLDDLDFNDLQEPRKTEIEKTPSYPGSARSRIYNESFLVAALQGKSPAEKAEILRIAHDAEIEKDDPLFAVFLATGMLEKLLLSHPQEIMETYQQWRTGYLKDLEKTKYLFKESFDDLKKTIDAQSEKLQAQSDAAIEIHKSNIARTVKTLVLQAAFTKVAESTYSLLAAGAVLVGMLGLGAIGGYLIAIAQKPELAPLEPRRLTVDETIALEWGTSELGQWARKNPETVAWVKSDEGQYARKLTTWNQALLTPVPNKSITNPFSDKKQCQNELDKFGVTMTLEGRVVKSGFCLLWIAPPSKRQFAN